MKTGTIVNQYKIISAIGKGGMGEVFLAQDTKLNRKVAIKFLNEEFSRDAEKLNRFVLEAQATSALNHPNILTVYGIDSFEDSHYIATEFIEGETLRESLSQKESFPLNRILKIGIQVAEALSAAHSAGIAHRDIKPENIMIRHDGYVKVLDFGLAKLTEQRDGDISLEGATKALVKTNPGVVMGTASYMSPEQAQGKPTDERTDIWSLGVVLYEMLAGKVPFVGKTINHTIVSIIETEPKLLENVPDELQRIVRKTLTKDADMRYQTARDLLIDLKNLRRTLDIQGELDRSSIPNRELKTDLAPENATQIYTEKSTEETQAEDAQSTQNITNASSLEYAVTKVKQFKFWYLAFAVLLIAGIGFGIHRYRGNTPINISFESAKITKVTDSGKVGRAAISPDGKWLVYSVVNGDESSLWLKQVAIPESNTQIVPPTAVNYFALSFSPDGNYLYYTANEGTPLGTLYQMPVLGGTPRRLISGLSGGISFSPDGKQLTYGTEDRENDESILMIANADGSEPRQLTKRKGNDEIASSRGRWSPDGKSILLWTGTNNPHNWVLSTVSVATGEITQFENKRLDNYSLWAWLPDGKSVLALANESPVQPLKFWQISYPSGEAKKVSNDLNIYDGISLTADANILATVQTETRGNIWVVPVGDMTRASQVNLGSITPYSPTFTPDGKLVYARESNNSVDIYLVEPSGENPKRLTSSSANDLPRVSPDGRYIVYSSLQSGTPSIWRMNIDGSDPKQLTTQFSSEPNISPDGREIIFSVGVDTTKIWKIGIDGGQPVQLTDRESTRPVFSPDGTQFACLWIDDPRSPPKIAIIPATGGNPVKTLAFDGVEMRWMPDGRSIAYILRKDGVDNIWSQPLDGGKPKQITNFTSEYMRSFDFSPDGKQIVVTRGTETRDVVLISGIKK